MTQTEVQDVFLDTDLVEMDIVNKMVAIRLFESTVEHCTRFA